MTWFRVDDQLHSHPKSRRSGLESMGLWALAGSFSCAYKTEGFVPSWFVDGWRRGRRAAASLVASGLWEEFDRNGESGWQFHDWEHHQPTADEIERSREFARKRRQRRRRKLADALDRSLEPP